MQHQCGSDPALDRTKLTIPPVLVSKARQSSHAAAALASSTASASATIGTENEEKMSNWKIVRMDKGYVGEDSHFHVTIANKGGTELTVVPDNLYSSIKYHISHRITGSFLDKYNTQDFTVRLKVVDPLTLLEIKQNNMAIVKGATVARCLEKISTQSTSSNATATTTTTATTSTNDNITEDIASKEIGVATKIQLTSCSYHHSRAKFAFMVSYYKSEHDLGHPVMVVLSNPFLCFARKPQPRKQSDVASSSSSLSTDGSTNDNTLSSTSSPLKRKRSSSTLDTDNADAERLSGGASRTMLPGPSDKKVDEYVRLAQARFPNQSVSFQQFAAKLEDLFDSFPKGTESERKQASTMVSMKLKQENERDSDTGKTK